MRRFYHGSSARRARAAGCPALVCVPSTVGRLARQACGPPVSVYRPMCDRISCTASAAPSPRPPRREVCQCETYRRAAIRSRLMLSDPLAGGGRWSAALRRWSGAGPGLHVSRRARPRAVSGCLYSAGTCGVRRPPDPTGDQCSRGPERIPADRQRGGAAPRAHLVHRRHTCSSLFIRGCIHWRASLPAPVLHINVMMKAKRRHHNVVVASDIS